MASAKKPRSDENYEKPSKHRQWQERSERPIAARPMTTDEIEEHRINLVNSYQCNDSDISYDFQKIQDENDEDRDDCLWLKYKMKCIVAGKPTIREVFSIKLPIPEELKRMAEHLRKQQANRSGATRKKPAKAVPTTQTAPQMMPQTQQTTAQTQQTSSTGIIVEDLPIPQTNNSVESGPRVNTEIVDRGMTDNTPPIAHIDPGTNTLHATPQNHTDQNAPLNQSTNSARFATPVQAAQATPITQSAQTVHSETSNRPKLKKPARVVKK